MRSLHSRNITTVSIRQLRNFVNEFKQTNKLGNLNVGELLDAVIQLSEIPDHPDTPYVCASEVLSGSDFKFFITTKKLLTAASNKNVINTDATYKVTYHGYPMHVYGMK